MFTDEQLKQLGELLEPINKKLDTVATKQDVKEIVEGNNRILSTLLKIEMTATAKEIIKAVKTGFQDTANQIKQLGKKLEDQENRISHLEQDQEFPHN
ncbi:MAG: hypothetical protein ACYDER_16435 [Ktedonobacteraceae bacterium]